MTAPHNIPLEQRDVEKAVSPGVGEDNNERKYKRPGPVIVPQAQPVNDTWWRRNFYLLARKLTLRFTKRGGGVTIQPLTSKENPYRRFV